MPTCMTTEYVVYIAQVHVAGPNTSAHSSVFNRGNGNRPWLKALLLEKEAEQRGRLRRATNAPCTGAKRAKHTLCTLSVVSFGISQQQSSNILRRRNPTTQASNPSCPVVSYFVGLASGSQIRTPQRGILRRVGSSFRDVAPLSWKVWYTREYGYGYCRQN